MNPFKMLVVIQPSTPGYPPLPSTHNELQKIKEHIPNESLVIFGVPETPATVDNVFSHLPAVQIVHLACHGEQNMENSLESALILEDGQLEISRIMQKSLPNASIAFLSACETAMGDGNIPDESIHIASSLLFAGFRGVVATMW
jgi:CHAT domain-containing protein